MHYLRTILLATALLASPTASYSKPLDYRFDPKVAQDYGYLINLAYEMYESAPDDDTPPYEGLPPPYIGLPSKYVFTAWIRMNDFTPRGKLKPVFYGLIVQRKSDPNTFVLALRGTDSETEWWDDLTSIFPITVRGLPGEVGEGFGRIFSSMEVIDAQGRPTDEFGRGFVHEVAAAIARRLMHRATRLEGRDRTIAMGRINIEVAGHSLGAALATLYVAANAGDVNLHIERVYTFASPRVGTEEFADAYDSLGIETWRIANPFDIITSLPLGFRHVNEFEPVNPGDWVNRTPYCLHSMITYLYLLNPANLLHKACAWLPNVPGLNLGGHSP